MVNRIFNNAEFCDEDQCVLNEANILDAFDYVQKNFDTNNNENDDNDETNDGNSPTTQYDGG